ncbi:MAG: FKBP-type peptidyl-prolyl cis-trans isomerase [Nitrospirae bacterium]|nr:FKBP-type peptidyl-prolyl cis-trans isomerase [Nitrospirota bacterium]
MQANPGDRVRVHYTLKDADGQVIESSNGQEPLDFIIGGGTIIPGFEKAVVGMKPSETKTIKVPPEEAYGLHDEKKIFEFDKKKAPAEFDPRVGDTVRMHRADGRQVPVTVTAVTEKNFLMDANHPLAGKELIFDLELVEIVKQ